MTPKDRRAKLLASSPPPALNGIDFVEVVGDDQTALRVHFLNTVALKGTLTSPPATITGGERIPTVAVRPIQDAAWSADDAHIMLDLTVDAPGDFSVYALTIISPLLDPFFQTAQFSFKARCPSDLDCRPAPVVARFGDRATTGADAPPPIDYLAKDFVSFRQALLDFSALRYPEWQERSEADFGMMFLEALCALADDLSYTQDRVSAEAALETATQRRSVVRLARLVDYEPRPATAASVLLQFNVDPNNTPIPDGLVVSAPGPDGGVIPFETGTGLANRMIDPKTGSIRSQPPATSVRAAWNHGAMRPYWFDDSQRCLRAGATQMYVLGQGFQFTAGQQLLIETDAASSADPPLRQIVRLIDAGNGTGETKLCDPLFPPPADLPPPPSVVWACPEKPQGTAVTLIRWSVEDALTADRDLCRTRLAGNLVPATQGLTQAAERFAIPPPPARQPPLASAVVRTGPNDAPGAPSLQYLWTLGAAPLAWLQPEEPTQLPIPEVVLFGPAPGGAPAPWQARRWLLDAQPFDAAFTVDPARYTRIGGSADAPRYDYDGDAGDTLRFGDGVFGAQPDPSVVFTATYRVGGGAAGNVAADTITAVDPKAKGILSATNPLPAAGGADPEPIESVRRLAPQQFQAVPERVVLPSDYQAAAESLPWVQRAGTVFRWTGSWLTAFTTPDPLHSEQITVDQRTELIDLLNRRRLAGYESYVPDPRYVSLDLAIEVCARPDAFEGEVEQALLAALGSAPGGFFDPDHFTFGQPLRLGALESAVQSVSGVAGVRCIRGRIRARTSVLAPLDDSVSVAADEIIRCDNDPSRPDHGTLKVIVRGGK
jgi:hypothetical protein